MAGKSREPREAAKLPNTSVKAAPKTVVRATTAPDLHPNDENVIRAAATPDPHPNDKNDTSGPATLTPYERMKKLVAAKDDRTDTVVMNTVEGLKARLQEQDRSGSGAVSGVIRMRLLWVSDHTCKQRNLVRLHLVDANAPESLEDQLKMTKRQGSTNYSSGEMEHLLALVRQHLPATKPEWIDVSAAYNATKEPRWKRRGAVSLKRKFRSMGLPSKRGDSRWADATRWVHDDEAATSESD
ncbi:hypothetical protein PR003_g31243 [Phytophthora rubi]|uniref:DUF6818 domain-containing protein n=1 Tax=Phytophthora rubi TaxID=129364 RepID=A0A6A4BAC0_9STRA|nr:hypothetical protein PR003_g31243 [Phytophthora rubi]